MCWRSWGSCCPPLLRKRTHQHRQWSFPRPSTYAEAAATPALDGATHVYVQCRGMGTPLADNYAGPYLVLEKGPKVKLQLEMTKVVSRDQLKPHAGQVPPAAAEPPRRGRPPRRVD